MFVVLTDTVASTALSVGFRPEQVQQIPNGVDVERYVATSHDRMRLRAELGIPVGSFVVLAVGQVGRRKGTDRLLAAWRKFEPLASGPVCLILVGAPDGTVPIDEIITAKDVLLVGHVNEPERYYSVADSFVLLSRSEGMANALLEAVAAGLPIIVSDIPPNRELASRLNGFRSFGNG